MAHTIKVFADGADLNGILELNRDPGIHGFTTNPTLMAKAGITNYEEFARKVLATITDKPISFEVFSDDLKDIHRQAEQIATWGKNVYVKIPVTNTKGESLLEMARTLAHKGVKLNITAVFTPSQIVKTVDALAGGAPSVLSIFAGRIADSGRDPVPYMNMGVLYAQEMSPETEVLWASTREAYNIFEAERLGAHIITVPHDILKKRSSFGKGLKEFSLDTVKMFKADSDKAGFKL